MKITLGEYELNLESGQLTGSGKDLRLSPRAVGVLVCLVENKGELVKRETLHDKVWTDRIVTDAQISKAINELRSAFGDVTEPRKYIETLPKRGYRLICHVSNEDEIEEAPEELQKRVRTSHSQAHLHLLDRPFPAYKGDAATTFVCYSHKDADTVYPEIKWLHDQGLNLWYDEGISPGKNWRAEIGDSLQRATHFLFYVSEASLASDHCNREVNFALDEGLKIIPVYLEEAELTSDLKIGLSRVQALFQYADSEYYRHLLQSLDQLVPAHLKESDSPPRTGTSTPPARPGITSPKAVNRLGLAAITLFLALVTIGIYLFFSTADTKPSLLILPFESLNLDAELAYLPAALNNDMISRMSNTPDFKLIAANSANSLSGSERSLTESAKLTSVNHILQGSIQSSNDRIRVSVRLIQTSDENVIWASQFDGGIDNLFDIQSDIAIAISKALKIRLDENLMAELRNSGTTDPEAYAALLKAKHNASGRNVLKLGSAVEPLLRAVELDPNYANAWAALAITDYISNSIINARSSRANDYADKALEIDPNHPVALRAKGLMLINRDPAQARNYLSRAVELMPQNAMIQMDLGLALQRLSQYEESVLSFRRAAELDPINQITSSSLVRSLVLLENYDEALAEAHRNVELHPNGVSARVSLASVYSALSQQFESLVELVRALHLAKYPREEAGLVLQLINYDLFDAATAWNIYFKARNPENPIYGFMFARIFKASGNIENLEPMLNRWKSGGADEAARLSLEASIVMMKADRTTDPDAQLTLNRKAFDLYTHAEALRPIGPQPISDLVNFTLLTKIFGNLAYADALTKRFDKTQKGHLWDTQNALQIFVGTDIDKSIAELTRLAELGRLNLSLLRECGLTGQNRNLYGALTTKPGFSTAIAIQREKNEALRTKLLADFPNIFAPAEIAK